MAEDDKQKQNAPDEKKKLPIKTITIVAAVLLVEAVAISAVFIFSGGPSEVRAEDMANDPALVAEQPAEVLIIADKFQNTRVGRTLLYDTEIYIVVKQKHLGEVQQTLEQLSASIKSDIAAIFRRAEPAQLTEPDMSTIRRQVRAVLEERLGTNDEGESVVQEVLIPTCTQFRADV
jgi:flagellar basal body-associated protein FliL